MIFTYANGYHDDIHRTRETGRRISGVRGFLAQAKMPSLDDLWFGENKPCPAIRIALESLY